MRLPIALLAAAASLAGGVAHAASVEMKDAVARVTVIPENRGDIKIEIISQNPSLPLKVRTQGDRTIIDGNRRFNKISGCRGAAGNASVHVAGLGEVGWRDIPQIVIRTPRDVNIDAGGAVFGSIGRAANVDLGNAGCGDWTVGNVEGRLRVSQAGSGNTRAGAASEAKLRVAGSGNLTTADVRGRLDVDVAGSGDVAVASVAGPLDVHIAGSGNVRVSGGHATAMSVSVAGSGDVNFGGVADNLKARIAGSGDVRARAVRGEVSKSVMGSGGVTIG
ncbi:hypothetical protein DJ021_18315 [Phenylobacterium hankyongense]|uniref:Putative auto-transporter adhesin head GIN domain-containing protein n=1 Tax=Phenylobacterium hankyongense TaxID=1813876 RepID=A0A328B4X4_9CAUL|nr:DUF2807 domain-containing protein [Phenylobacterium hankyongense]RAK61615.1 hypothetical protein DJ021_18315 [Phenylobacterium hankyongense]